MIRGFSQWTGEQRSGGMWADYWVISSGWDEGPFTSRLPGILSAIGGVVSS